MSNPTVAILATPFMLKMWEFQQSVSSIFPRLDSDCLDGEETYHVWVICMQTAFEACGLQDIISGALAKPTFENASQSVWLKMNASIRVIIVQYISNNLVTWISHLHSTKDVWDHFTREYSQTGT